MKAKPKIDIEKIRAALSRSRGNGGAWREQRTRILRLTDAELQEAWWVALHGARQTETIKNLNAERRRRLGKKGRHDRDFPVVESNL